MQIGTVSRLRFCRDLEDSKSPSGGTLCVFGSHTFVPISWMCKKQTSVSHSSTELDFISLDAALRLDGKSALDLWDLLVSVLHGNTYQSNQERGDPCTNLVRAKPHKLSTRNKSGGMIDDQHEAVIKMLIKGRSPTMRHVSRNHRVALDWLFDRSIRTIH